MPNSNQKNPLGILSEAQEEAKPYHGEIFFYERTIYFYGTIILRQNITQIQKYGVKRVNKISDALLVLSFILFFVGFTSVPYTLLLSLIFGFIIYLGIKERNRPKLSGLTIELSSGATHNFLSPDKKGIDDQFSTLLIALEKGDSATVIFSDNKFTTIIGDRNNIGDNNISGDKKN